MSSKANKRHLKRLNAPIFFGVKRKENKYVVKPLPGRFNIKLSVPLALILRKLGVAENNREIKIILSSDKVKVNGKIVRDRRYPIGIQDVITIQNSNYRVGITENGKVKIDSITEDESKHRVVKVINKYKVKGGKIKATLFDGTNVEIDNNVKVNDSLKLENQTNKILDVIKFKENAQCLVIDGLHVGKSGKIKDIKQISNNKIVTIVTDKGEEIKTVIDNVMCI
ncbi:MAG: 30S ribosomal protein S4e [Candidatus Micrarchaeota archaeon]|nr:MAG: 30S ribosomal protein S4e [Candidatus Micrarchaeota archaeon]